MLTMPALGARWLLAAALAATSAQPATPVAGRWVPFQHTAVEGALAIVVRDGAVHITNTTSVGPPTDVYRLLTDGNWVAPPSAGVRRDGLSLQTMEPLAVQGRPAGIVPSSYELVLDPAGTALRVERRRLEPSGGTHLDTYLFVRATR